MSHEHHHKHEEHAARACDGAGHEHHHHEDGTCCCEQHAKEFHGIDKPMLLRLIFSALCYAVCLIFPVGETLETVLLILCAVSAGYDIVFGAVKNLFKGRFFDEYFLMSFAAIAAFIIGEYEEGAAVFLLYRIGAFCQSYAIRHSRRAIADMTGAHDHEDAGKATPNRFITSFSRIYTPVILCMAVIIAVLLPVLGQTDVRDGVYRALTFLVLACPCAIVISVPMAYFAGIAAASRVGVFFRDSEALDLVAKKKPAANQLRTVAANGREITVFSENEEEAHKAPLVLQSGEKLPAALSAAGKTRKIAHENVWFIIAVKLAVLVLAVCGISALWFAVFADSGVTVIVVLNSLRAFRIGKTEE